MIRKVIATATLVVGLGTACSASATPNTVNVQVKHITELDQRVCPRFGPCYIRRYPVDSLFNAGPNAVRLGFGTVLQPGAGSTWQALAGSCTTATDLVSGDAQRVCIL